MMKKIGCGCLIIILAFITLFAIVIFMSGSNEHNARFHNAQEIYDCYGVRIPDVVLVDSDYKSLSMPAFESEYYINTYAFIDSPSLKAKTRAVKALNNIGGNNDVEAELSKDGTKIIVKFHFIRDTGDYIDYEEDYDKIMESK